MSKFEDFWSASSSASEGIMSGVGSKAGGVGGVALGVSLAFEFGSGGVGKLPRSSFIIDLVWQNLRGVSREKSFYL